MNTPAADHPDLDALCDLHGGLLAGSAAEADLATHIADCASCTDFLALLATTGEQLAGLPALQIPSDVAARIDSALAAEAATVAATEAAVVTPMRPSRRSRRSRWMPSAGAVAAGVALLMAAGIGISALTAPGDSSGREAGLASDKAAPTTRQPRDAGVVANYTATTLAGGVQALVAGRTSAGAGGAKPSATPLPLGAQQDSAESALARLRSPSQLAACVAELAGRPGVTPLAVDFAFYEGSPAVIIVLPGSDAASVQAWVVGPACTTGKADLRRHEVVPRSG